MDQLAEAGVTALAFSGGEPLTRSDFFEVARHASDHGLYVSLASNGTLLTKENVRKIKQAKVNYIDVSIDGASAKTHDEFRGVPGTFDKALAGLKNCVEADLCVCIATTVGKNNMAELPAIIDLAEKFMRNDLHTSILFLLVGVKHTLIRICRLKNAKKCCITC